MATYDGSVNDYCGLEKHGILVMALGYGNGVMMTVT